METINRHAPGCLHLTRIQIDQSRGYIFANLIPGSYHTQLRSVVAVEAQEAQSGIDLPSWPNSEISDTFVYKNMRTEN